MRWPSLTRGPRLLAWLALATSAIVLFLFPRWTVDDAYITYRYAQNLANHGALTWNVGEDPVEGYTGVLLPVMVAAAARAGLPPPVASHAIGVLALLATGLGLELLLRRLRAGDVARGVALLLYATTPFIYTHAWSGLETSLFSAMVLASFAALFACLDAPASARPGAELRLAIVLLVTSLARPEGVALAAAAIAAVLAAGGRPRRRFATRVFLGYVLPGAVYFAWRWRYYGELMPNTFYAKAYEGTLNIASWRSFAGFALRCLMTPAFVVLAAIRPPGARANAALAWTSGAALVFGALVLTQYARSTLDMNYSWRFFLPFLAPALAAMAVALSRGPWARGVGTRGLGMHVHVARTAITFLVLGQLAWNVAHIPGEMRWTAQYERVRKAEAEAAGEFVRRHVPPAEWLIVSLDAGTVPYQAGLRTADFGLLNDETLAHHRLTGAALGDYFFSFRAGAIVFASERYDRVERVGPARDPLPYDVILGDPRFAAYRLAKVFRPETLEGGGEFAYFVYLREDLMPGS